MAALNKSFDRVSRTWIHEIRSCMKDAARGRLPGLTIENCLSADRRGKVGRVEARTLRLETRKCSADPPAFGVSSAPVVNQTAFAKEFQPGSRHLRL